MTVADVAVVGEEMGVVVAEMVAVEEEVAVVGAGTGGLARMEVGSGGGVCFTLPVCVFHTSCLCVCFTLPVCLFHTSCMCVCFTFPVCVFVSHFLYVCLRSYDYVALFGRGKHQVVVNTRAVPFLINDVLVTRFLSPSTSAQHRGIGEYTSWGGTIIL